MSYYISYNPEQTSRYPSRQNRKAIKAGRIMAGIIVVGLLMCCLSIQKIRNFLIPGDPELTIHATTELLTDIKNGEGLIEAFTTFCETVVINGAE